MAGLTMEKAPCLSCFLYFLLKYPLLTAPGGRVCSWLDLSPLQGMSHASAPIPVLDGMSLGGPT